MLFPGPSESHPPTPLLPCCTMFKDGRHLFCMLWPGPSESHPPTPLTPCCTMFKDGRHLFCLLLQGPSESHPPTPLTPFCTMFKDGRHLFRLALHYMHAVARSIGFLFGLLLVNWGLRGRVLTRVAADLEELFMTWVFWTVGAGRMIKDVRGGP